MALFSRLFKYAPLPGRTQLENFLTESLCDLLERMTVLDRKGVERFVLDALAGSRSPSGFRERLAEAKGLYWTTQKSISFADNRGYLDLCLLADKRIILVIENKIGSGFTSHSISQSGDEDETTSTEELLQLDFYDRWLSAKCPGAALVLLSHLTEAPPDFLVGDGDKTDAHASAVFHHVCRWAEVYDWVSEWIESSGCVLHDKPAGVFLNVLSGEFLQFLEQKNMNVAAIKDSDLDLLSAYFSQDVWKKMRNLMVSMRLRVVPLLADPRGSPRNVPQNEAWEETQILWDWAYSYEEELEWYVGWGLSGKHGLRHLDIELDTSLQAFVVMTNDDGGTRIPFLTEDIESCEKAGWVVCESKTKDQLTLVKTIPTQVLAGESAGFTRTFEVWTEAAVGECASKLKRAHDRPR